MFLYNIKFCYNNCSRIFFRGKSMKKILAILLILCCSLPAAAKKRQNEEIITPVTQLEKRQFQTKSYPAKDNMLVMKSILNVLQDEGFIVYNVNSLLGYIYGVKDFDTSDPNVDISQEFGVTKSRLSYNGVKVATLEVSVNVTQYGEQARVRANFKRKLLNEYGNAQMIDDIDDSQYYADFYTKVDNAIALQKQIENKIKKDETPVSLKKPSQKVKPQVRKPQIQKTEETVNESEVKEPVENVVKEQNVPVTDKISPADNVKPKEESLPKKDVKSADTVTPKEEIKQDAKEEVPVQQVKQSPEPEQKQPATEPVYVPEQVLEVIPVDPEPEHIKSPKEEARELKELVKQAKLEAKQAEKEAKQAQKEAQQLQKSLEKEALKAEKEAMKAEKQALKEAIKESKRQAKEMRD